MGRPLGRSRPSGASRIYRFAHPPARGGGGVFFFFFLHVSPHSHFTTGEVEMWWGQMMEECLTVSDQ